ncbi:LptF/LptG family permease [Paraprevotella clara]|uniref:LptF/LptG family permease n=1 Tax=Paraprevotella clara TaxID=454154 RepID=UPI003A8C926E
MLRIKKLDIFILKSFCMLFMGTFFICLFIFMMQFMWRYVDELIGKGLTLDVLAHFFYYAGLTLIPMSLPLAILLASLITFGNLGERFELLSMKAAGIPLIRILQPIIIFNILLCIGSFYFQNVTGPEAQKKFYTLIYSMKQKSPELEIPEGIFYSEIPGYNIFVEKKGKENGMLYGVMIYSTTDGYEDAQIVLADSAELKTTADEKHLMLTMYAGERFRNMQAQGNMMARANVPYMWETFIQETDLIPFDNNFNMMDANVFSGSAQTKNLREIETGLDSLAHKSDSIGRSLFAYLQNTTYRRKVNIASQDSAKIARQTLNFDTLYSQLTVSQQQSILRNAMQKSTVATNEYEFRGLISKDIDQSTRTHWVEWHKKFTLSLACLFFFFIGAPLGAIIRKGGLGVPVVISVTIFIFYYIINVSGEKMAKSGEWVPWFGEWLSSMVLCPIGIFLTYKANKDSAVFNIEAYINVIRKILGLRISRHIARKEVIIHDPDYPVVKTELMALSQEWQAYAQKSRLRLPPNYLHIFFHNIDDHEVISLSRKMENLITILSNSRDAAILDALNKLPIVSTHAHTRPFHNYKWNMVLGIIFPVGIFFYFRIWRYRLRLYKDIQQIKKYSAFIAERIKKISEIE